MLKVSFSGNYLQLENARIIYRNFAGTAGKYNREGDRNFAVIIPDEETKDMLVEAGWNVKIKPPREEYDEPFMFLPVKVKFNSRGPAAYVRSGDSVTRLNEDTIEMLDEMLMKILVHFVVFINSYFLIKGEKYYNENVGAE